MIGWFFAMIIWELLRNIDLDQPVLADIPVSSRIILFMLAWLSQALFYGLLNIFVDRFLVRRIPFRKLLLSILSLQLVVGFIVLIIIFNAVSILNVLRVPTTLAEFIKLPVIPVSFIYAFLINFCIAVVSQVDMMLGGGNLLKIIRGQFYTPQTVERIFMFLDLRGSTTIAEKIGHIKYSRLLQDCFYDLSVVHNYKADIYQYVGDEAVLVWPALKGLQSHNCIAAFFAFQEQLKSRSDYYMEHYGVVPEFKAGMNIGEITIAEVGVLKREIAYHGDTINTAARVQGECNRLKSDLLISEQLLNKIDHQRALVAELKDQLQLRGKEEAIKLYAISRNEAT